MSKASRKQRRAAKRKAKQMATTVYSGNPAHLPYGQGWGDWCHSHYPQTKIFSIGGADIYGMAGRHFHSRLYRFAVTLVGTYYIVPECNVQGAPELRMALGKWAAPCPYIHIECEDQMAPAIDRAAWVALKDYLATLDGPVAVMCEGGHGRTGTALAILGTLSGAIPQGTNPINWVRSYYCEDAIESWAQEAYIAEILGFEPPPKPIVAPVKPYTAPVPAGGTMATAAAATTTTGTTAKPLNPGSPAERDAMLMSAQAGDYINIGGVIHRVSGTLADHVLSARKALVDKGNPLPTAGELSKEVARQRELALVPFEAPDPKVSFEDMCKFLVGVGYTLAELEDIGREQTEELYDDVMAHYARIDKAVDETSGGDVIFAEKIRRLMRDGWTQAEIELMRDEDIEDAYADLVAGIAPEVHRGIDREPTTEEMARALAQAATDDETDEDVD